MSGNLCSKVPLMRPRGLDKDAQGGPCVCPHYSVWGLPGAPALGYGSSPGPLTYSGPVPHTFQGEHQIEEVDQLPAPHRILTHSSVLSPYERQLNLDGGAQCLEGKRKRRSSSSQ